jgi:hypothetical protein
VASQAGLLRTVPGVPDLEQLVGARRNDRVAVGVDGTSANLVVMAHEQTTLPAGVQIPDAQRLVSAGRDHERAVGADRASVDAIGVPLERRAALPLPGVSVAHAFSPSLAAETTKEPSGAQAQSLIHP